MATFSTFTAKGENGDAEPPTTSENGAGGGAAPAHTIQRRREGPPDTKVVEEGSSRRNIVRKGGNSDVARHAKTDVVDDGSSVLYGQAPAIEPGDPLYDPYENDDNYVLVSADESAAVGGPRSPPRHNYDPDHRRMVFGPMLTLSEFKRRVVEALNEFFSSEDVEETIGTIKELGCPEYHYEVVKRAISMAMDRKERERELVSKLLSASAPELMSTDQLGKGFERLFEFIDDLELDTPGATEIAAAFLARAVVDEIIPPAFLVDPVVIGLGGDVVAQTKRILSQDHNYSRVERIWGPGDGRPVSELKVAIDQLLNEYLLSKQLGEAERCVREMEVPHFHHELVKRAVEAVLDKPADEQTAMSNLLEHLHKAETVSPAQLEQGFRKLLDKLPDLVLDSPNAKSVIDTFLAKVSGYCPEAAGWALTTTPAANGTNGVMNGNGHA